MLRQGDAEVFKLYSQAKLGMMREALTKLDRAANERESNFRTERPQRTDFIHIFRTVGAFPPCGEGGRSCSRRSFWSGRRDLNPIRPVLRRAGTYRPVVFSTAYPNRCDNPYWCVLLWWHNNGTNWRIR
jgi:hypothetical protein